MHSYALSLKKLFEQNANPAPVRKFVKAAKELHPLSRREALKNIGE